MNGNEWTRRREGRWCVCIECDARVPREDWITCYERRCPMCGAAMVMEGSPYHVHLMDRGEGAHDRSHASSRVRRWKHRRVEESYG